MLARMGFIRYGWEVHGALSGGTEKELQSVLEVLTASWNSQRTYPKSSIADGDHTEP